MKYIVLLICCISCDFISEPDSKNAQIPVSVYLIMHNWHISILGNKKLQKGDTVVLKKTIDKSLINMPWYSPNWELDTCNTFSTDTIVEKKNTSGIIIYYARGIVQ